MPETLALPRARRRSRRRRPPSQLLVWLLAVLFVLLSDILRAVLVLLQGLRDGDAIDIGGGLLLLAIAGAYFVPAYHFLDRVRHVHGVKVPLRMWVYLAVLTIAGVIVWLPSK